MVAVQQERPDEVALDRAARQAEIVGGSTLVVRVNPDYVHRMLALAWGRLLAKLGIHVYEDPVVLYREKTMGAWTRYVLVFPHARIIFDVEADTSNRVEITVSVEPPAVNVA